MVKPQLNLDKKDEPKKPDGSLVKVVTIAEEPAPLNPEPIYSPPHPRRGGRACKCLSLCFLIGFLFLLTFLCIGYFVHRRYAGSYGWCGVGYYDDWDYAYYDDLVSEGQYYSSYEWKNNPEKIPYGDDMLRPPRPTGPPLARFLEEGVKIDITLQIVRINHPGDEMRSMSGVDVVHDFKANISAYLISEECYLRPLNYDSTLNPQEFQDLMETEAFKDQHFPFRSELYTVNPEKVYNLEDISPSIEGLCDGIDSYYIQSVPAEQWSAFWPTARAIVRDHLSSSSDDDSSEEGRGHGGRHGGRRGGRHHGGHSDDSDSSSEEGHRRGRLGLRGYMENFHTFDGKSVTDMHVFQYHKLEGLSQENQDKLAEVGGGFMP